jgi:hypothetical protein
MKNRHSAVPVFHNTECILFFSAEHQTDGERWYQKMNSFYSGLSEVTIEKTVPFLSLLMQRIHMSLPIAGLCFFALAEL